MRPVSLFASLLMCLYCAAAQTNVTDSILHQTLQRRYMVHLPPSFTTERARPLVMNLHGGSGTMINAQGFTQMNPVADRNDFVVVWPQGYGSAPPGYSWADGRNTSADQMGVDDVGFIRTLIDTLTVAYNIDPDRVYVCGFSNGGFMVQRLACELTGRFAAMASLGCSMDTVLRRTCSPTTAIPMAFFNGTADPQMPYEGGAMQNPLVTPVLPVDSAVRYWVKRNGCTNERPLVRLPDIVASDSSTVEVITFTDCDCNADVLFYRIVNGGHTWPGVYVMAQERVLGITNRDIMASDELWSFFRKYTRCGSVSSVDESPDETTQIGPNPFHDKLNVRHAHGDESYRLVNALGSVVYHGPAIESVNLSSLPPGMYAITITSSRKAVYRCLVKQ